MQVFWNKNRVRHTFLQIYLHNPQKSVNFAPKFDDFN